MRSGWRRYEIRRAELYIDAYHIARFIYHGYLSWPEFELWNLEAKERTRRRYLYVAALRSDDMSGTDGSD